MVVVPGYRFAVVGLAAWCASACAAPIKRDPVVRDPVVRDQQVSPKSNPQGQAAFHLGLRSLDDEDFYEPVDEPFVFGFDSARRFQPGGWLGYETGLFFGLDYDDEDFMGSEVEVASLFFEGDLGLRVSHDIDQFQVFAGAGVALILVDVEIDVDGVNVLSEDDFTVGPYFHIGAIVYVAANFFIGLDARLVTGTEIEFSGFEDTDADYKQIALVLGWGA